jgi:hypothetical protein
MNIGWVEVEMDFKYISWWGIGFGVVLGGEVFEK